MTKKKQKSRSQQNKLKRLARRMKRKGTLGNNKIILNPPGEAKMSEMLGQIIEPYVADAETLDAYHKLVSIGALAWNNTLLPPEGQAEGFAIADKLGMSAEDKDIMNELIIALMKRKIKLFPKIHRFIVDFEVSDMGNQWHLSVASTMPPGES